jgi:hypothetical protein
MSGFSKIDMSVRARPVADMRSDLITMSTRELERVSLMRRIAERRTTRCTLLVYVDDATSRLTRSIDYSADNEG